MAQRPMAHPDVRPKPEVSRHERMAEIEAQGEALGEEYGRLEAEENDEREEVPASDVLDSGESDTGTAEDGDQDAAQIDAGSVVEETQETQAAEQQPDAESEAASAGTSEPTTESVSEEATGEADDGDQSTESAGDPSDTSEDSAAAPV